MPTNPTPLTAEDIAATICSAYNICEDSKLLLQSEIEAYAAQQNAKLGVKLMDLQDTHANLNKDLNEAEAENERLKQQLAWQPLKTAPKNKWVYICTLGDSPEGGPWVPSVAINTNSGWEYEDIEVEFNSEDIWYWSPINYPQPLKEAP